MLNVVEYGDAAAAIAFADEPRSRQGPAPRAARCRDPAADRRDW
jgi:hypothetical protein